MPGTTLRLQCANPSSASMLAARRTNTFTESVIREMTRLNLQLNGPERAVNFAQGFPDFSERRSLGVLAKSWRSL